MPLSVPHDHAQTRSLHTPGGGASATSGVQAAERTRNGIVGHVALGGPPVPLWAMRGPVLRQSGGLEAQQSAVGWVLCPHGALCTCRRREVPMFGDGAVVPQKLPMELLCFPCAVRARAHTHTHMPETVYPPCLPGAHRAHVKGTVYISLGHPLGANTEQIRTFSGSSHVLVQCTKISFRGGGVYAF